MKEVSYGFSDCYPGSDFLCNQCGAGTDYYSIPEKTENGSDRACGRCPVTSEKSGNSHDGRDYFSVVNGGDFSVLCEGLPEDHSHFVFDFGIWNYWLSG